MDNSKFFVMIFSKSFGYALRGILYVAMMSDENRKIRIDEMAKRLSVPRHFLGKIMNKVVKKGILSSTKGPNGGFSLNNTTLSTSLLTLVELTDGVEQFDGCVLRLRKCNAEHPCPLHHPMETYKNDLFKIYSDTNIGSLLKQDKPDFIQSIAVI
jgi:Rrf2 family transcriptional regulator, iron-sulfur cluster assembly transcription factor